jgi:hypothetical protein
MKRTYDNAVLERSVKDFLIRLGVPKKLLPAIGSKPEIEKPVIEKQAPLPKRFRRTRKEMEQLKEFTQWQIAQRTKATDSQQ